MIKTKLSETKVTEECLVLYSRGGGMIMLWPVRFQCVWSGIAVCVLTCVADLMYYSPWLQTWARYSGTWLLSDGESLSSRIDGDVHADFRQPLSSSCHCPYSVALLFSDQCRLSPLVFQFPSVGSTLNSCVCCRWYSILIYCSKWQCYKLFPSSHRQNSIKQCLYLSKFRNFCLRGHNLRMPNGPLLYRTIHPSLVFQALILQYFSAPVLHAFPFSVFLAFVVHHSPPVFTTNQDVKYILSHSGRARGFLSSPRKYFSSGHIVGIFTQFLQ